MANDETTLVPPDDGFKESAETFRLGLYDRAVTRFEMIRKDKSISLRLPEPLLDEVRKVAKAGDMPYQRFIRLAIERALQAAR